MNNVTSNKSFSIAAIGCLIIAVILTIGTFGLGRIADHDTKEAVRNVSLLYLSELAGRREQVVSSVLDDYISDMDVALGLITKEDLSSIENLQAYQLRMKQLYGLDKFAFVDTEGLIYTSRGTRTDIDEYGIDYENLSEPEIKIKNLKSNDKKVIIAVPADNLVVEGNTLVVCFMEIDMDRLLSNVSLQSNNNTTFCNIYTKEGVALTNVVLGGLASEDNLLEAMEQATYESGYSYEQLTDDFNSDRSGEVSFSYNGISETLYYVPIRGTNWMLTYLIRESIISEQISSISESIIFRSLIQSALTAVVLAGMFILIFIQQRQASKASIEREVNEAENRVRQQELEEQLAMQEELASKSEELAKALKAAEDASQAKSVFVSNMSHEIRTPITAILGMNEMIRRECNDENILSYADNINNAGISLLGIISDILDFSKIEAGHMELVEVGYSLPSMITDIYNLISFRAEAKGLELKIRIDSTLPSGLIGDELRIKQIIVNLLTNAVKYTEKGRVSLEIKGVSKDEDEGRIKISFAVSDTGIGIREEEMGKLFVPFDRLDVSRTKSIEGTGLGLSISRQLLHMMDSDLMVESKYDHGSTFSFVISQGISDISEVGDFDPGEKISHSARAEEKGYFRAPGKRILVVDDMPMNIQVLKGLLKRSQMIIDTASGGEECIEKVRETDYDLIFLDYRMPVLDGIETIRRLKEFYPQRIEHVPVIALTASAIAGDREKLLEAGFTDYMSKPVIISEMEDMMKKYIRIDEPAVQDDAGSDDGDDEQMTDLPQAVLDIAVLDHKRGIEYCGDAEDYLFILKTYSDSVDDKSRQLEECLEEERIEDYSLLAHSLKSMSESIGAKRLHDMAKALEKAGREGDLETLKKDTPEFLTEYRSLGSALKAALE